MLVTGLEILQHAAKNKYAVGAFNINNMEILQAIISACEDEQSPVIIQTAEKALRYAGADYLAEMVKLAAKKTKIPVALHLDHGKNFSAVMECIKNGWSSIMFDGSHYEIDKNISETKKIVEICHAAGITSEAELGQLGGVEDDVSVDAKDAMHTDPDQAARFVTETGVDYLAIAIGTAHGKYKGEPKLDFDRLKAIRAKVDLPLVLHGASGVPEDAIRQAVSLGISKINIDTDLRVAFTEAVKKVIIEKPEEYDPRELCGPAREAMRQVVRTKIQLFGSAGKA